MFVSNFINPPVILVILFCYFDNLFLKNYSSFLFRSFVAFKYVFTLSYFCFMYFLLNLFIIQIKQKKKQLKKEGKAQDMPEDDITKV